MQRVSHARLFVYAAARPDDDLRLGRNSVHPLKQRLVCCFRIVVFPERGGCDVVPEPVGSGPPSFGRVEAADRADREVVVDRDDAVRVREAELAKRQLHAACEGAARHDMDTGAAGGGVPERRRVIAVHQRVVQSDQPGDGAPGQRRLFFQQRDVMQGQLQAGPQFVGVQAPDGLLDVLHICGRPFAPNPSIPISYPFAPAMTSLKPGSSAPGSVMPFMPSSAAA